MGHTNLIYSLCFNPGGTALLTAAGDRSVRIWDLKGERQLVPREHMTPVVDFQISPDGRRVLSRSAEEIYLWNIPDGTIALVLRGFWNNASFSDSGSEIVTCYGGSPPGEYDFETLWGIQNGEIITRIFKGQDRSYRLSPGAGKEWKVRYTGSCLAIYPEGARKARFYLPGHLIRAVVSGSVLVALTADGHLLLYEIES